MINGFAGITQWQTAANHIQDQGLTPSTKRWKNWAGKEKLRTTDAISMEFYGGNESYR